MTAFLIIGIIGIICCLSGVLAAAITRKKAWHILTVAGVIIAVIGLSLSIRELISVNREKPSEHDDEIVGGDWRTWRGYTEDYTVNDDLTVCFSRLDDNAGYGAYDCNDGTRIGSLVYNGSEADSITAEDKNGDGVNEICVYIEGIKTIVFTYLPDGVWPETAGGCFSEGVTESGD